MSLGTLVIIVALLLLIWLLVRRRNASIARKEEAAAPRVSQESSEFHAVSIRFESNACKAAREMEGRRFLSTAAPRLPLPGCDVLECNCRFLHHKDRRTGRDRRSPFGPGGIGGGTGKFEQEQRQGHGRRKSDDGEFY